MRHEDKVQGNCVGKWSIFDGIDDYKGRTYYPFLEEARRLCSTCPVFDVCDKQGELERAGIWAGQPRDV